ncbi:CaiB/BaiF CoA transferase family protein [Geodermatophilus sp. URMC 61]|uniref:CaiB/BaiF CoA transferase family protein n=1 Tax=Geodermatophilus sp. URMC 61 TaxID=3423411 RepID=UPI00406C3E8A
MTDPTHPAPPATAFGPLAGVRVLDIGNVFAAPFAAALLGDMGADVVKVELPGSGDPARGMAPSDGEEGLLWAALARNKRAITLDLRHPEGQQIFLRLLATTDVLVENFRPGTLDRWGLTADRLREANPDLVVARISGYGQTGPYAGMAGFGTPATAFSGYLYSTGFPDRPPVLPPMNLVDYMAGTFAAFGTVAALYHRDAKGGSGQEVDVALYESMLRFLEGMVTEYDRLGQIRERTGNEVPATAPLGLFESADGVWLVLSTSTDRTFDRFAEVMGRTDMSTDPRYRTNRLRVENRAEVDAVVTEWFATHTAEEILRVCDDKGVPVSRVNNMADVFADPHVQARDMLVEVQHPKLGSLRLPGIVPKLSATPGEVRTTGPSMGDHNAEVYGELGLDATDLDRLATEGVI